MRTNLMLAACLILQRGQPAQPVSQAPRPVIHSGVSLVTTNVTVRDEHGQFVSALGKDDFDVFEDGVRQDVVMFLLTHGGRVFSVAGVPAPASSEGLLLPPSRPPGDSSGRVFLIFVDDAHIDFRNTARVRDLLKKMSTELIHEGDLFGIVSTGSSSLEVDMTYDRKRLAEAIGKVAGHALQPSEIIATPDGSQGPPEVRHRAHVAFSTAYEILQKLEEVHDRRKVFIYVSEGYDFDPYARSRSKAAADRFAQVPDTNPFSKSGNEFAPADLAAELSELTRQANRANTTMYTFDPRGLPAGADIDQTTLDSTDWQDHLRETLGSLRTIAESTGGFAAISTNDHLKALKRIDSVTSDYYLVGYYSSNPDPQKKRRTIEIRVKPAPKRRADTFQLSYTMSYTLKPPK